MMMTKIKMEMKYTQATKIREEKNKNTITHKDSSEIVTGQAKIRKGETKE